MFTEFFQDHIASYTVTAKFVLLTVLQHPVKGYIQHNTTIFLTVAILSCAYALHSSKM